LDEKNPFTCMEKGESRMHKLMILAAAMLFSMATPHTARAETAPSVAGVVQQYLLSPHEEVEGLLLADGTVVKFPKHLGVALASSVRPTDQVTVVGFLDTATPQGRAVKALTITDTRTGQTLIDQPPATPPLPPDLRGLTRTPLTVIGTVARFLVNPQGDVDGLILSGSEQVRFRPRQGALAFMMLSQQPRIPVTASGYGTRNAFGTVVDEETLTAAGQSVQLAGGRGKRK